LTEDNLICRKIHEDNPTSWPTGRHYIYLKETSNTLLRPHIEKYHLEEYKRLAKEHGWKILLPGLVSQAQSEASVAAASDERPDKFDEHTFYEYLLNFIIADDQVYFFPSFPLKLSLI
jgi:hypothetical protein